MEENLNLRTFFRFGWRACSRYHVDSSKDQKSTLDNGVDGKDANAEENQKLQGRRTKKGKGKLIKWMHHRAQMSDRPTASGGSIEGR